MKKIIIFLLFLFLLTNLNTVYASDDPTTLTQGIYNAREANLLVGTPITVKIPSSSTRALIIITDSNQIIQEIVRLEPHSTEHTLKPLNHDSEIIILSNGRVTFS